MTISNCVFSGIVSVTFRNFFVTLALAVKTSSLVWVNNNRFYCWELVQLQSCDPASPLCWHCLLLDTSLSQFSLLGQQNAKHQGKENDFC